MMSNNEMVSVPREQALAICNAVEVATKLEKEAFAKGTSHVEVSTFRALRYALDHLSSVSKVELRALLAAPVESCGACNGCTNGCRLERESPIATKPVPPAGGEPEVLATVDAHGVMLRGSKPLRSVELVDRAHVTRLQTDIEDWKSAFSSSKMENARLFDVNVALQSELDALKAQPQGEPAAKLHAERLTGKDGEYGITVENSEWFNTCRLTGGVFNLYAEPPAPVAVIPPEHLSYPMQEDYDDVEEFLEACEKVSAQNACLDEVTRLNPKP